MSEAEGGLVIVYALFGSEEAADRAARDAVESRLAACANRLAPCTSIYRWEGKIEQGQEVPVLFKTMPAMREALMARIAAGHDYDVPALLSWQADAVSAPYLAWAKGEVGAGA